MKNPVCISPADNCPEQDTDVANLMTYFEKRRHFDNQHESESYERFHESAPLSWTLYMTRARELNRTPTQLRRNRHRLTCRSIYFWGCSRKISLRELHQRVIDLLIWKGCFNRNDPPMKNCNFRTHITKTSNKRMHTECTYIWSTGRRDTNALTWAQHEQDSHATIWKTKHKHNAQTHRQLNERPGQTERPDWETRTWESGAALSNLGPSCLQI